MNIIRRILKRRIAYKLYKHSYAEQWLIAFGFYLLLLAYGFYQDYGPKTIKVLKIPWYLEEIDTSTIIVEDRR